MLPDPEDDTPPPVTPAAYRPFPVEALPEPCRTFVAEAADAIGCDHGYIALPMLACLARSIGNTRTIKLKRTWQEPAIIWGTLVGKSGRHKTPALSAATVILARKQAEALALHADAVAKHEIERVQYERDLATWKRSKSTEPPPWEPQEPACQRYTCGDVTIEALAMILDGQPDGVLVVRDELAGWLDGQNQYKGGRGSDVAHWLACWSGAPLTMDRKTGDKKMMHVPRASVSIVGGIQPGILRRAIGKEHMQDGLCARLLLTMPPPHRVVWTEATIHPDTEAAMVGVLDRLLTLESATDDDGHPKPLAMPLTPEAKSLWVAWYDSHRAEMAGLDDDLAAAWSKLEAYAARLALIVQLCSWADGTAANDVIDQSSIEAGIALSDWFGGEARRVYEIMAEDTEAAEQRELCDWIARQGGSTTARELRSAMRRYRGSGDAEAALEMLAKARLGRWEQPPPGPRGGQPARQLWLAPASDTTDNGTSTAKNTAKTEVLVPVAPVAGVTTGVESGIDDINVLLAEAAEEAA